MVDPTGDAVRFSGEGKLRICSTLKDRDEDCGGAPTYVTAVAKRRMEIEIETEAFMGISFGRTLYASSGLAGHTWKDDLSMVSKWPGTMMSPLHR